MSTTDHYVLLTELQKNFVEYYLTTLNATEAATRAGYSAKSARAKGSQLLANVNIAAVISERRKAKLAEISIEQDRVLSEVAAIAFSNYLDVAMIGPDGELTIKNPDDIPAHALKAIKKIVHTTKISENDSGTYTTKTVSLEMFDKMRALEFLGRYFGITEGKGNENEGTGNSGDSTARTARVLDAARRIAKGRGRAAG